MVRYGTRQRSKDYDSGASRMSSGMHVGGARRRQETAGGRWRAHIIIEKESGRRGDDYDSASH